MEEEVDDALCTVGSSYVKVGLACIGGSSGKVSKLCGKAKIKLRVLQTFSCCIPFSLFYSYWSPSIYISTQISCPWQVFTTLSKPATPPLKCHSIPPGLDLVKPSGLFFLPTLSMLFLHHCCAKIQHCGYTPQLQFCGSLPPPSQGQLGMGNWTLSCLVKPTSLDYFTPHNFINLCYVTSNIPVRINPTHHVHIVSCYNCSLCSSSEML